MRNKIIATALIMVSASIIGACDHPTQNGIQSISTVASGSPKGISTVAANRNGETVALWEESEVTTNDEAATSAYRCERTLLKAQIGSGGSWSAASTLQTGLNRKVAKLKREFVTTNGVSALKSESISDYLAERVQFHPQAFVADNGDVIALWMENHKADGVQDSCADIANTPDNSVQLQLYTATYTRSTATWSTPARFDTATGSVRDLKLVRDAQGNAYAVWRQNASASLVTETDLSGNSIVMGVSYRAATATWETITQLSTAGRAANTPDISVDQAGSAIVVWQQSLTQESYGIFARRYIVSAGWHATTSQLTAANTQSKTPKVAMDSNANATVVWVQRQGTDTETKIYSARFTFSNATWSTAALLQTDDTTTTDYNEATEPSYDPNVAVDSLGNVMVVWTQERTEKVMTTKWNNNVVKHIFANVYANDAWGNSFRIDTQARLDSDLPHVAAANDNRFYVAWREGGAFHSLYLRGYTVANGLESIQTLTKNDNIIDRLEMQREENGNVRALWMTSSAVTEATIK